MNRTARRPVLLGLVEGDVGSCDQVGRAHPHVALDQCDPGAGGQVGRAGARPDDREQAAGPLEGLRLADPRDQDPEFVAVEAGQELAVAEVVAEHLRDVGQDPVALLRPSVSLTRVR